MDEVQFIRDYAEGAKTMNRQLISWHADRVRMQLGQVRGVDWDTPGGRAVHCQHPCAPYGHFHYVVDNPVD